MFLKMQCEMMFKTLTADKMLEVDWKYDKTEMLKVIGQRDEWTVFDVLGLENLSSMSRIRQAGRKIFVDASVLREVACRVAEYAFLLTNFTTKYLVRALELNREFVRGEVEYDVLKGVSDRIPGIRKNMQSSVGWGSIDTVYWALSEDIEQGVRGIFGVMERIFNSYWKEVQRENCLINPFDPVASRWLEYHGDRRCLTLFSKILAEIWREGTEKIG
jgi:hypothetical protein